MNDTNPALTLFQPEEVRRKAHLLLDLAAEGGLAHVGVDLDRLDAAVATVLETTKENYPDFQIPPYGIWRGFEAGGIDRWQAMASARGFETAEEMLAAAADLALLGIAMTTLHPSGWQYEDRMTETTVGGAQASALAAFHMFASGSFSSEMTDPYRVDASALVSMDLIELAAGLQWDDRDDADHLKAMQRHLKRLGEALALRPDLFGKGEDTRPGLLAVQLAKDCNGAIDAGDVLDRILEALAPVWEGGATSGDIWLGDAFVHSALPGNDVHAIMPFHLAAQQMVYSLVEPFAWAGFEVAGLEKLTAPADLTHAALFVKSGVLTLKDSNGTLTPEAIRDRMIEIRALTIALTDKLAERLAGGLGMNLDQVPFTCILEGGTDRAGNRILEQAPENLRDLGKILNPGAVFWLPFGA
ncbi:DUF1688 family protein [Labrenzia sp. VG12]|uniref:DUF1688 family protein n=1 Tax=Labrenzia sp. VG12 TaxID=2021862 RepID=UPI000B8C0A99|nr:DUF1688 family protein [Labrenzia sp. VG12]ASP35958.1 hypothetical protein CHH27_24155 [Labrenzia sp. VG12]